MVFASVGERLRGRVEFLAQGGFPDLFLEECAVRGAALAGVKRQGAGLCAFTDEKNFPLARAAAERAGMDLTVTRRTGLPSLLRRYRARAGIPAGLLAGALLLAFLSGRVWEVRVTGNRRVGSEEILDVMEELGVTPGTPLRRLDLKAAEREAQNRLPQLSWIAVNVSGCKVLVEVREIIETPKMTDERDYANIVASRDGVIVRADVLEGAGQPLVGSAVVKGDLLVSGVIEMNNGFRRFVNAKAVIRARTKTRLSVSGAVTFPAECVSAFRATPRIRFFGLTLPPEIPPENVETEREEYQLQSRTTVFPIGVLFDRRARYETRTVTLSEADAALLCFSRFCRQASERYREAELLRREIRVAVAGGEARVSAECLCVEEIGERRPFSVADGG